MERLKHRDSSTSAGGSEQSGAPSGKAATAQDRRDLRRELCGTVLRTLQTAATAPLGADPAALIRRVGKQADALRVGLRTADGRADPDNSVAWAAELEELHCHLHDTTLQVLEYLACGGYGLCTDVPAIREVAARGAADLANWLEIRLDPTAHHDVGSLLRDLASDSERLGLPPVHTTVTGDLPPVDATIAQALAGAVREALTNVRKHARADGAQITAVRDGDALLVSVADDGVGFDGAAGTGIGLPRSILGRLERVGGIAQVVSSQQGTQVRLRVQVA